MAESLIEQLEDIQTLAAALEGIGFGGDTESVTHNGVTRATLAKQIKEKFAPIFSVASGYVPYETLVDLTAAGAPTEDHIAFVWFDPTNENNGVYGWNGSAWVKSLYDNESSFLDLKSKTDLKFTSVDGLLKGIDSDIFSSLIWIKGFWQTGGGAAVPNGSDIGYNAGQYTWYTRLDVTDYQSVTITGAYSGAASSATVRYAGINVYGDGVLVNEINNASGSNTIYLSDYAEYDHIELVIQCRNTSNIADFEGVCVVDVFQERFIRDNDLSPERSRLDKLELIANGIDSDIFSTLAWVKGWWQTGADAAVPNGSDIGYNAGQYAWYTRLDVTDYQSVTITGAYNGGPASTATIIYPGIAVYGDGALVDYISNASGSNTIYPSDYAEYDHIELVIQCRNTSNIADFEGVCVVRAFRNPAPENQQRPKRLVMVGDSLLGHDSAAIIQQMNKILAANGYDPVISRAMGGENAIGNLTRAGGIGVRVTADATLPDSVDGVSELTLGSAWMKPDGTYAVVPYAAIAADQFIRFGRIVGKIGFAASSIAKLAFYDSSNNLLAVQNATGTHIAPNGTAKLRYSINNPQTGEAHVTIAGGAVDIDATATVTGYISNVTGAVVADTGYLCSNYISCNAGDSVYFDALAIWMTYTFTRVTPAEPGESLAVAAGAIGFDSAVDDDSEYAHVWFTGQNGGYEDEADWGDMVESATRNLGNDYIVCSTALVRTTPALVREATRRFGRKYLNFREYMSGPATSDAIALELVPSGTSKEDWQNTFWNPGDSIHQNDIGSVVMAAKMWNLLLELGYVEGVAVGPDVSDVDWVSVFGDIVGS